MIATRQPYQSTRLLLDGGTARRATLRFGADPVATVLALANGHVVPRTPAADNEKGSVACRPRERELQTDNHFILAGVAGQLQAAV